MWVCSDDLRDVPSYFLSLLELLEHVLSQLVWTHAASRYLIQPIVDQLLRPGLLPHPFAGGAVDHLPGPLHEPTPAPLLQLTARGEPLVVPVESGDEVRHAVAFHRAGQHVRLFPDGRSVRRSVGRLGARGWSRLRSPI